MTLQERLVSAQQESTSLYLRRQTLEVQRQQLHASAAACDQRLLVLDGVLETLQALIAEAS